MSKYYRTIVVPSRRYEDFDDCLSAAAMDYLLTNPEARGYDMDPRWGDDDRETILLDVPNYFLA